MKVKKSVEQYLCHVQEVHKPKTHETYTSRIKSFVEKLGNAKVEKLTAADIVSWLDALMKSKNANDTKRGDINAFLQWQHWAVAHQHLTEYLMPKIKKPPGNQRERVPTDEEFKSVLAIAKPAFAAVLKGLRWTGARPAELAKATIADWDREANLIVLLDHKTARKTGKPRLIGVGQDVRALLEEAIGERQAGPIFLNDRGQPWTENAMSHAFRRLRDKLKLSKDLVLYSMRHAAGTEFCEKLGIYAAKELLGHTSINMTQRYAHSASAKLAEWQDQARKAAS